MTGENHYSWIDAGKRAMVGGPFLVASPIRGHDPQGYCWPGTNASHPDD